MKILILTDIGALNALAYRVQNEGHEVKLFIFSRLFKRSGTGLAERVEGWRPHVKWCDLAIVDKEDFGAYERVFRDAGKPVLGCSKIMDFLREPDRLEQFANVTQTPVYTPEMGTGYKFTFHKWWNGRGWLEPNFTAVQDDTLFPYGVGPPVGVVGGVMVADPENRDANELFLRLSPLLRNSGYRGPVDIDVVYLEGEKLVSEIRGGFSSGLMAALMEGLRVNVFDTMYDIAHATAKRFFCIKKPIVWVSGSIPPWPYSGVVHPTMISLGDLTEKVKHLHFVDVIKMGESRFHCGGATGKLFEGTAMGEHIKEARRRVYRMFRRMDIPYLQYRHDIGNSFIYNVEKVSDFGAGTEEMAQCLAGI